MMNHIRSIEWGKKQTGISSTMVRGSKFNYIHPVFTACRIVFFSTYLVSVLTGTGYGYEHTERQRQRQRQGLIKMDCAA